MTEQQENLRFKHLYWFAVGVLSFCAGLSVFIVYKDHKDVHTATILTFWLSTGAAGCIGYLIGSSANKSRAEPKMAESVTAGTVNVQSPKVEDAKLE